MAAASAPERRLTRAYPNPAGTALMPGPRSLAVPVPIAWFAAASVRSSQQSLGFDGDGHREGTEEQERGKAGQQRTPRGLDLSH
ncbi:hypothetical protein Rhe02_32280 [Rhizocola hellebori]|uniref:Uncharacterized protein n=1 Tax=Rhizocola hellebori TaxID=1392758 RepID=A0A8J3Q796_9ACTN|nr:hypothetical protein Rhe02_32280 [Rhizocola hellebori]